MRNFVILTRHSPWTYGLVNTLLSRGCIPQAIVFEGGMHDTLPMRCIRLMESIFLRAERAVFFRRHPDPHHCYRRHGSLAQLLDAHSIAQHRTENHNDPDTEKFLGDLRPDYILLCGTRLIKPHILAIPRKGALNAHSAMLPHYRGAKSEYWLLSQKNYDKAGVTIHWVDAQLDTGDICLQERIIVSPHETTKSLRAKSLCLSAHLFAETLRRLENGEELRTKQGEGSVFTRPAPEAVRGFDEKVIAEKS